LLQITEVQREELTKWSQSRTLPAGDVFRARLILALADGWTWARIAVTLRTTKKTIALWKARFAEDGIDGLEPRHKGSQPRAATAAVQARVARRVQQKPPDGSTHWSCRKLAADLGMSHETVQRILARAKLGRIVWTGTWRAMIRIFSMPDYRRDRKAARTSAANNSGCSQAAKWPPLSTSLK
jgi:transposase